MVIEVKVPTMGESITSGLLSAWHVKDGDFVKTDQALYELETDKITSEGVAEANGRISLRAKEGAEVEVDQVIAAIDDSADGMKETATGDIQATPELEVKQPETQLEATKITKEPERAKEARPAESPAVRHLAAETGIDLASVSGTGKGGRVTKGDILKEAKSQVPAHTPSPPPPIPGPGTAVLTERVTRKKMTPMRRRIAERLVAAQHSAAILSTFNEVDMSEVMALRKSHQEAFVTKYGVKLGFMSFFLKATVKALKEVPAINAQIDGEEIVQNHYYDIGVAVSTPKGLLVPVVRNADTLSFAEIELAIAHYAKKAREGGMSIEDLQGGVFTITNGGIFGSLLSTPILNQPQSGILGMHTIKERPVVIDGQVAARPMMYLAFSYDHRLVDGSEAVTFLVKIKEAIENPARLLLEI